MNNGFGREGGSSREISSLRDQHLHTDLACVGWGTGLEKLVQAEETQNGARVGRAGWSGGVGAEGERMWDPQGPDPVVALVHAREFGFCCSSHRKPLGCFVCHDPAPFCFFRSFRLYVERVLSG